MKKIYLLLILLLVFTSALTLNSIAATICVDPYGNGDYTDLQSALSAAGYNGESDTIRVVQGTYSRTGGYSYSSNEGYSITLIGGCTSGCTDWVINPSNTVLDAQGSGGVLYVADSAGGDITIQGFTAKNGNKSGFGGGIYARSLATYSGESTAGDITIDNNIVKKNTSAWNGGGIYAYSGGEASGETGGAVTISNNTVTGNSTDDDAGGIYAESRSNDQTSGAITLSNNIISDNTANLYGGVHAWSYTLNPATASDVALINNIISGNTASTNYGGAFADSNGDSGGTSGKITIYHNTITGNSTSGAVGGIYLQNSNNNTINCYNNIIRGNTDPSGVDITLAGTSGTSNGYNNNYSTISGTWNNHYGNINADPEFIDPEHGDFRLRSSSSCKDAGDDAPPPPSVSFDFEGNARWIGIHPDIGADEVSIVTTCVSDETGFQNALTTAQSNSKGDVLMVQQGTYTGNFIYNPDPSESNSIALLGGYTASCANRTIDPANTVLDGNHSGRVLAFPSNSSYIRAFPITIEGFTVQNGNTSFDGGGINIQTKGGGISLSNNTIKNNTASTGTGGGAFLQSAIPYGSSGSSDDISFTNNVVSENSCAGYGGGLYINTQSESEDAGDISGSIIFDNNHVTGNSTTGNGGGVYMSSSAYSTPGTIRCTGNIISGNTSDSAAYGAAGAYLYTSTYSIIPSHTIAFVTNNTIAGNTNANGNGGGIYSYGFISNFYNNIIWGNTSTGDGDDIYIAGTGTAYGYNNDYTDLYNYAVSGETWNGGYEGNIDLDPKLSGSYYLRPGSPCIDAGTNTAPFIPTTDINGNNRIMDGDRDDTATVDMGAFEYIPKGVLSFLMLLL